MRNLSIFFGAQASDLHPLI